MGRAEQHTHLNVVAVESEPNSKVVHLLGASLLHELSMETCHDPVVEVSQLTMRHHVVEVPLLPALGLLPRELSSSFGIVKMSNQEICHVERGHGVGGAEVRNTRLKVRDV